MMQIIKPNVMVFDLDDTLYKEIDYVTSGIDHVLRLLESIGFNLEKIKKLKRDIDPRAGNFIDLVCHRFQFSPEIKNSLLWAYRLHYPSISLSAESMWALDHAEKKSRAVCVLTDGRSVTQRLKLQALGLYKLHGFISEEYGLGKPHPAMFEAIQKQWPDCHYIYIGDNPVKDFLAPNHLGWTTIGLLDDGRNIRRSQTINIAAPAMGHYQPKYWVSKVSDVEQFI